MFSFGRVSLEPESITWRRDAEADVYRSPLRSFFSRGGAQIQRIPLRSLDGAEVTTRSNRWLLAGAVLCILGGTVISRAWVTRQPHWQSLIPGAFLALFWLLGRRTELRLSAGAVVIREAVRGHDLISAISFVERVTRAAHAADQP